MSKQYRQAWRKEYAAKIRQERVITEYMRITQPILYAEAVKFYNTLREKYANKNDLRKVAEFKALKPKRIDNLNLQIPLLSLTTQGATTSATTASIAATTASIAATTASTSVTTASTAATTASTSMPSTTSSIPLTPLDISDTTSESIPLTPLDMSDATSESIPLTPLDVSDATLETIIKDLQQDPQLGTFFNDINMDIDMDTDVALEVMDTGITPLEQELSLLK